MTCRRIALVAVLASMLLPAAMTGQAQPDSVNPHIKPGRCESCHSKTPTDADVKAGTLHLLKDSIDETCHLCHSQMCCDMRSLHLFNHPSGIDHWDTKRFKAPKTLPLQNGFITCNTCHFHSIPDGPSYKMVRIVRWENSKIEWSYLCRDCHIDK